MNCNLAYIIMTEHWDSEGFNFATYNQAVFTDESDAIDFLNNHSRAEFSNCDDDIPHFCVDIIGIGGHADDFYDASDKLQAAIDAANER